MVSYVTWGLKFYDDPSRTPQQDNTLIVKGRLTWSVTLLQVKHFMLIVKGRLTL